MRRRVEWGLRQMLVGSPDLQEENSRLLRNEEELLLLVLDMEAQIERLSNR